MKRLPYPPEGTTCVAYIIDAANSIEESLLKEWIEHQSESFSIGNSASASFFTLPIAKSPEHVDASVLRGIEDHDEGCWIIPVRVVWTLKKQGSRQTKRLRDLLKGQTRFPSPQAARRLIKSDPRSAVCIAGEGASLADLKKNLITETGREPASFNDNDSLLDHIAGQAALALEVSERRLTGGRYKVPRRVAENIKRDKQFVAGIEAISKQSGRTLVDLERDRDQIFQELIALPQPFWVDMSGLIAKRITGMAYESNIVIDEDAIARVREIVSTYPTAFLWTHKSHVDGMAMQQVMYENDLPATHTFGGLNMAFAGLGYTSRRSGTIFIRRTFQDNPLYKLILRHYIGYLLKKRFPFSWAFEGTRSRVGKLMPPRFGLLKYLVEAAHETNTDNLHFIPVSIGYDLIEDVADYAREQAGETKRPESLKWFVGYLNGMRQPMGRIYMEFGEPVVLEHAPDPDDHLAISKIAFQVAVEANRVTPITLTSLAALVLLTATPRALTRQELSDAIAELVAWVNARKIPISNDMDLKNADHAELVVQHLIDYKLLSHFKEGELELYSITSEQHAVAAYYRNNTIHHFLSKAFAEIALLAVTRPDVMANLDEESLLDRFWREIEWLKNVFKFEFFYPSSEEFRQQVDKEMTRYEPMWKEQLQGNQERAALLLRRFKPWVAHGVLIQFAEAYWLASAVLTRRTAEQSLTSEECVSESLVFGRQALLQQRISSKSSIGKQLFKNAFQLFDNLGLSEAGGPSVAVDRHQLMKDFRELINRLERIRARALPH